MVLAIFGQPNNSDDWSLSLTSPLKTFVATRLDEVARLLEGAEAEARSGSHVALFLSYEAAPAFDSAFRTHTLSSFPLAWAAVFKDRSVFPASGEKSYSASRWIPRVSQSEYHAAINAIRKHIGAGDTYQVNYTFPLYAYFEGDAYSWYCDLCQAQGAQYCAYLDLGRYQILSVSPELFFERKGNQVKTKPMKGTIKRGRWAAEDSLMASLLNDSAKDKAENVMIVDLLRNDLGKVSLPGSVKVSRLYELERFETLWQMTSTVESTLIEGTSLASLMAALFPCGSITGAPKVRTMEIIRSLEAFPRGTYTGAIGYLRPGGDCTFNVAIRTLILDSQTGKATFAVGGGVTSDSTPEREYEECVLKSSFLLNRPLRFQLFESILLDEGQYFLLEHHVTRMKVSADFFGFSFSEEEIRTALELIAAARSTGLWKTRVLLARDGAFATEVFPLKKELRELNHVALASEPVDSANRLLFHKTTSRRFYSSQLEARADCDDIIFWNERREVTESSVANVVLPAEGKLFTPPVAAGLLAGTFRDHLIAAGKIEERTITIEELCSASEFFLINSVRKWMRAVLVSPRSACAT